MSESLGLKRELGFKELLSIAIGQTIGSGVMAMTGTAIGMTGRGVVLAYILSSIIVVLLTLPIAQLGSTLPTTGGEYMYTSRLLSPQLGIFYMFVYLTYNLTISIYAISFADYMSSLLPSIPFKLIAVMILTLFYIFNLLGIKTASSLQKIMVLMLMSGLFVFIVFGISKVDYSGFTSNEVLPSGFKGLFTAAALLTFATGGANAITHLGGEMKNPGRDIPWVMFIATVLVGVVYALLSIVASGILPVEQVANQNLGLVAKTILPGPLYVYFIVFGAMFAITTTLNSVFSWVTKPLLMFCKDGYLPAKFGEINERFGTPHWLLTTFYLIGLIPVVTGVSLASISTIGSCIMLFRALMPVISTFFIYRKYPDACEKSYFIFTPKLLIVSLVVATIIQSIQVVMLLQMQPPHMIKVAIVYVIGLFIASIIIDKRKKIKLYTGDAVVDFKQN